MESLRNAAQKQAIGSLDLLRHQPSIYTNSILIQHSHELYPDFTSSHRQFAEADWSVHLWEAVIERKWKRHTVPEVRIEPRILPLWSSSFHSTTAKMFALQLIFIGTYWQFIDTIAWQLMLMLRGCRVPGSILTWVPSEWSLHVLYSLCEFRLVLRFPSTSKRDVVSDSLK